MDLIQRAKGLLGDVVFHCENSLGRYRLQARDRKPLAVLVYHGLEADAHRWAASSHRVTPEGCLKEIRFFQRQGYQLASAEEIDCLKDRTRENCAGYLLVSFDDGHANTFPHLHKWLERYKIPVLLGICPGVVEEDGIYWWEEVRARFQAMGQAAVQIRASDGTVTAYGRDEAATFEAHGRDVPHQELQSRLEQLRLLTKDIGRRELAESVYVHKNMNWQQIRELSNYPHCTLASHSMHHEIATRVSAEELRRQTQASIDLLEARTGRRVQHYVYPNGSCSEATDRVLAALGIRHAYAAEGALNSIPPSMRLKRFTGYDYGNRSMRHYGGRWRQWHSGAM